MAFVSIKRYLFNQVLNFASYSHYPGSYVSRVTTSDSSGAGSGSYRRDSRSRSRSPITDDYDRDDRRRHRSRHDSDSDDDEYQSHGSSIHEKRTGKLLYGCFTVQKMVDLRFLIHNCLQFQTITFVHHHRQEYQKYRWHLVDPEPLQR